MTRFSEEIFDQICDQISEGNSLKEVCRGASMPSRTAFYGWINDDATGELAAKYELARELQADFYADEILRIADTCEDPKAASIIIAALKRAAALAAPRKYGKRVTFVIGEIA